MINVDFTQRALFEIMPNKLNLIRVTSPLFLEVGNGIQDDLGLKDTSIKL